MIGVDTDDDADVQITGVGDDTDSTDDADESDQTASLSPSVDVKELDTRQVAIVVIVVAAVAFLLSRRGS